MPILEPRSPGFSSIRQLCVRFHIDRTTQLKSVVSVDDADVPSWQRQTVWTEEEMGLLAYSIVRQYPVGIIILWQKESGIRVPIDGRQRLTAVKEFAAGNVAIPDLPSIEPFYRKRKYRLLPGDQDKGYQELNVEDRDAFDGYEIKCVEYQDLEESIAMDIFVKLQGGKSLTKTEVRSALGGNLCDFVTELTTGTELTTDEEEEETSQHDFFKLLAPNMANKRKAHRNMADILVHEVLHPGEDKHWLSLETLYREKSANFSESQQNECSRLLKGFLKATTITVNGEKIMMPQLKSTYLILSFFRVWRELKKEYDGLTDSAFSSAISRFEQLRVENKRERPWVNFTSALSNAGYAKNRIKDRHQILTSFLLSEIALQPKERDNQRLFTLEQKIVIWERANHQCEWEEHGNRCTEKFPNPRSADADHIVQWAENGKTTVENGRLLCQKHNRGR